MRFNFDHIGEWAGAGAFSQGLGPTLGCAVIVRTDTVPVEGDEFLVCPNRMANVAECRLAVASDLG